MLKIHFWKFLGGFRQLGSPDSLVLSLVRCPFGEDAEGQQDSRKRISQLISSEEQWIHSRYPRNLSRLFDFFFLSLSVSLFLSLSVSLLLSLPFPSPLCFYSLHLFLILFYSICRSKLSICLSIHQYISLLIICLSMFMCRPVLPLFVSLPLLLYSTLPSSLRISLCLPNSTLACVYGELCTCLESS